MMDQHRQRKYDQEIPKSQSQTAGNPLAPRGRAAQPSRDTRKTKLSKAISYLLSTFSPQMRLFKMHLEL